jgi:hypothetical protein
MSISRQQRRAAERQARKNLHKQIKSGVAPTSAVTAPPAPEPFFPDADMDLATLEAHIDQYEKDCEANTRRTEELAARILAERQSHRAAVNQANAQHSTGPRTETGKAASSQNSFKHGIYSNKLILPDENPAELEHMKAGLMKQHQPDNLTEYVLVTEMAEHFWRMQRFRRIETNLMNQEELYIPHLTAVQRFMNSAERSFYKALKTLQEAQRARTRAATELSNTSEVAAARSTPCPFCAASSKQLPKEHGFVPQNRECIANGRAASTGFVVC